MKNTSLSDLDNLLAGAVDATAPSVVRVRSGRHVASGFVVRDGDLVLTSGGAIRKAQVQVTDAEGAVHDATVLGRDRATDVAVLRLEAKLPPLALHDPDELATGHLTLALARPGRAIRASLRIVGVLAEGIDLPWGGRLDRYVETDRGLPRGFNGGPLVDLSGRVVGLNTDRVLRGADLAVPRATLERVVDAIVADGGVKRGYLGVSVRPVRLPAAMQEQLEQPRGALVAAVEEGSPAEAGGLLIGDVLLRLDDDPVAGPRSLAAALRGAPSASRKVKILRAGELLDLEVETGERV